MSSFWNLEEKFDFEALAGRTGQITVHSDEGRNIIRLLDDKCEYEINTIVEIGTWNGLGSTLCILEGIKDKKVRFWSLECNKEKHESAVQSLSDMIEGDVKLVWGSIVDIDIVNSIDYRSRFSTLEHSDTLQLWFNVDIENCGVCPNVLHMLPEKIDFLLLDGGEFTTLYEFECLFDRCDRYIALDDIFTDKCREVRKHLLDTGKWEEIVYLESRNGFSIFRKSI